MGDAEALADACAQAGAVDVAVACSASDLIESSCRSRDGLPNLDDRVFEVGSISKTFLAFALARSVLEGQVALDDPLRKFMAIEPSDIGSISLLELATHTSGLPRLPPNLRVDYEPQNPYSRFGEHQLIEALSAAELGPKQFLYSNFAYGLLGVALATADQPLDTLMHNLVFERFGLRRTRLAIGTTGSGDDVDGHDAHGLVASHWDFTPETAGCGAVRSTVLDLLHYATALTHLDAAETELLLAPRVDAGDGRMIGLAWWRKGGVAWHTGGTGAFGGLIGLHLSTRRRLAILTSSPHEVWRAVDSLALDFLQA
jgi:serine-type D-Ala-D-Ala carboxypeptidase/endopeptidase